MSSQLTAPTASGPRGRRRALSLLAFAVLTAAGSACAGLSEQGASTGATNAPNAQAAANNQPPPGTLRANASATVPGAPATSSAPQVTPTPGRMPLPDAVKLAEISALDGPAFRLSDFGDKVIVLNLWATWCGPCRMEIPHLVELNKEYAGRVEFVGLTTEDRATAEPLVREFVREYKMDYRVGFSGPTVALALMQNRTSIPQLFIIRDGQIFYRFIGFNPQVSPPRLREGIEATLKAGA